MKKIKYDDKLYYISIENISNNTLLPRIPDNYFTKYGYEDNIHKRVCFCKTIEKCLMALSINCKDFVFNVYEVDDINNYQIFKPNTKEVPDSYLTGELWILTPVKLKFIGKIKCIGSNSNDGYIFNYGDKTAKIYDWKYKWL